MYVSPSSHCAASAALSAPPALQQWRERTCTWFHAPVAEPARDGQTTPLVIRGHLLAAPTWHTPQTLAEPVASDALTALLKAPHHGLQEHRYCKPSASGQFKFMSGQQRFHASYAVDNLPGSELVCHFAVTDPAGKKLVEFGTPPARDSQAV